MSRLCSLLPSCLSSLARCIHFHQLIPAAGQKHSSDDAEEGKRPGEYSLSNVYSPIPSSDCASKRTVVHSFACLRHSSLLPKEEPKRRCMDQLTVDSQDFTKSSENVKNLSLGRRERRWTVHAGINDLYTSQYYYVNPVTQPETKECLEAVKYRRFLLLTGSRASGKTTRLYRLRAEINAAGDCECF
jgi:hypothetical protein